MRAIATCALLFAAACNNFTEHKLPTFPAAQALARTVDVVPAIPAEAMPPDMPWMVPFARIRGDFQGGNVEEQCLDFRHEIADRGWEPDVIIYAPAGATFAGMVSNYIGFGVTMSNAVYRPQADAYCMRLAPISLGVHIDEHQMVIDLDDATRASGIQEGDKLISVNGRSVKPDANGISEMSSEALSLKPGSPIKLIWIRPGTGRMDGSAVATDPRPVPTSVESVAVPLPMRSVSYYGDRYRRLNPADDPLARPRPE
jgi:hypothetical protein